MRVESESSALTDFRTVFDVGAVGRLTDGQLLERFATDRGEPAELAFAALVERHGAMVLRVCRSVLNDASDTDDAFQATFLILIKKARGLWVRESLGPWLHQVALRTASCARRSAVRRRRREQEAAEVPAQSRATEPVDDSLRVLHEELGRLPERYRAPIVLCDLEGRSHEQTAQSLGWPVGTVKSRLSRGRERLRSRLVRRGLAPATVIAITSATRSRAAGATLPAELLRSTTRTVFDLLTGRPVIRATVASLAQGALWSMATTRWLKSALLLIACGVGTSSTLVLAQRRATTDEPPVPGGPRLTNVAGPHTVTAAPGTVRVSVTERGTLEALQTLNIHSEVEGQTAILMLLPEGTRIKKGDLVCELDSASLRDQLVNQEIATKRADADYQRAEKTREVAQMALNEYTEGTFKQEQAALRADMDAFGSAVRNGESRLQRTRAARGRLDTALAPKGAALSSTDILAQLDIDDRLQLAEQALDRARFEQQQAGSKLQVLERFTGPRMTKLLGSEIERSIADELAKKDAYSLEKSKQEKLNRQIAKCRLIAPTDGLLVYGNDARGPAGRPVINEGATIRERQMIFQVWNARGPLRVNTKVRESMIGRIVNGLPAVIKVHAFPDQTFRGVVRAVAPLPDPTSSFANSAKVYSTYVEIENPPREIGLRPSLTADVEIVVAEVENVLTVPVQAVRRFGDKDQVAVRNADAGFEWREVTLGVANDALVEVKQGIRSGDIVISDAKSLNGRDGAARPLVAPGQPDAPARKDP